MESIQIALIGAILVGIVAVLLIAGRRQREEDEASRESPFAASTEGTKLCPKCSMGNMWTDRDCISCGARLPG